MVESFAINFGWLGIELYVFFEETEAGEFECNLFEISLVLAFFLAF